MNNDHGYVGMMAMALLFIGALLIAGLILVVIVFYTETPQPEYPLSCGLSQPNESESYTITAVNYIPMGKFMMPQYYTITHYRQDLVCTNGTTILGYR